MDACTSECEWVFTGPRVRIAYQTLKCDNAVLFIEGESGRPPGTPLPP